MSPVRPESVRVALSLLAESWDDALTDTLSDAEVAALMELWLLTRGDDSSLLRSAITRLRTTNR